MNHTHTFIERAIIGMERAAIGFAVLAGALMLIPLIAPIIYSVWSQI